MRGEFPAYTHSELYVVSVPPLDRAFFTASAKPRWVVGMRTFLRGEIARSPFDPSVQPPDPTEITKNLGLYITLIDAFTRQPVIAGVPYNRVDSAFIAALTKNAGSPSAFPAPASPFTMAINYARRIDIAGSWIYNAGNATMHPFVEVFYNDGDR